MNVPEMQAQFDGFAARCKARIAGVGAEQYYDVVHNRQKFESQTPAEIIAMAQEELEDLANYAFLTSVQLNAMVEVISGIEGEGASKPGLAAAAADAGRGPEDRAARDADDTGEAGGAQAGGALARRVDAGAHRHGEEHGTWS